jgi:glycine cleavage system H protein
MAEREEIGTCVIHKELHYSVADNVWVRRNDDGTVTVGMTDIAQGLAGPILHAKVKKIGTVRKKGRPIATVESSKWVGPVKLPVAGTIIGANDELAGDAQLINRSPYSKGWLVQIQPDNLEEDLNALLTGDAAVEAYRQRIESEDLTCTHLEGFED